MNAGQPNADEEKNHFDFFFKNGNSLEDLRALKQVDFDEQRPRSFEVKINTGNISSNTQWDETLLNEFTDVFKYFKEKKILWETFGVCSSNCLDCLFMRRLLCVANGLGFFKKLLLYQHEAFDEEGVSLCSGLHLNNSVETVVISRNNDSLSEADSRALGCLLQSSTTLTLLELTLHCVENINHQEILKGIAKSMTLKKLHIGFPTIESGSDEQISQCVNASSQNQNIEELLLVSHGHFGDLTSKAIENLLSSKNSLRHLKLSNVGDVDVDDKGGKINVTTLVRGLKKNRSLNTLFVEDVLYGDLPFSSLFNALPDCPSLKTLYFDEPITTQDLEQVKHLTRLKNPLELKLKPTVVVNSLREMTQLLHAHPEVKIVDDLDALNVEFRKKAAELGENRERLGAFLQGAMDFANIMAFNHLGRYLLDRSGVPLSLWPLVFARARDTPDILYGFLQGQPFVARQD